MEIAEDRRVRMFGRNTIASAITLLLNLAILWVLVEFASVPRIPAAAAAFVLPLIAFYFLQREWVFPDTDRRPAKGFAYFLINVGIGFAAMLSVFWALTELAQIHYLVARVAASGVYGLLLFLLNGRFNFGEL